MRYANRVKDHHRRNSMMHDSQAVQEVFRFRAMGVRGAVTLTQEEVHTKTRTTYGWWEQTVPLRSLAPRYSKLRTSPPTLGIAVLFTVIFIITGCTTIVGGNHMLISDCAGIALVATGFWLGYHTNKHRTTDWIMIASNDGGHGVSYTRQGPDIDRADEFTEHLMARIKDVAST